MARLYRLAPLGFQVAAGTHVLAPRETAAVDEVDALLAAARAEAEAIVEDARRAREEERRRGYEDGLAEARLAAMERLLQESRTLDEGLRAVEGELAGLVASCVRKLMDEFNDTARAEAVVRSALKQMRREKKGELRVDPTSYPHFRDAIARIVRDFPEIELVDVVADPGLPPSRLALETSIGRVEADFRQGLDELEAIVRRVAQAAAPAPEAP